MFSKWDKLGLKILTEQRPMKEEVVLSSLKPSKNAFLFYCFLFESIRHICYKNPTYFDWGK